MATEKNQIRRDVRQALRDWGKPALATASRSIVDQLAPCLAPGDTVLAFWPLTRTEPDIQPLLVDAVSRGVGLCLPRTAGTALHAHRVENFDSLERSDFGVREPIAGQHPEVALGEITTVLVPGVAFTRDGARLGRGGGHYDRFLARLPGSTRTIGIAFSKQICNSLPTEAHDIHVGQVIADNVAPASSPDQ